ncbi:AP-4 complex subunit epsilon-1 [Acropora cervicornis]|uniref:AP-4 complex subunit epsilon-1 n=1 Tax=Acropora cervicornis TaxID=6130 RepID=A0AAD9QPZ3_ACRCE|nr:AP-4 complex subunit epsilon-1 [Acropora cervicornis]
MTFCLPQVTCSAPVAHRDDARKQHLAAQLFSGVTGQPRSASRRGHFGSNRLIKHSPKTNPRATGSPPIDGFYHVVHDLRSLSTEKADVNLLQDFDSDQGHAHEIERTPSIEHALIPTLDVRSSLDNENSTTEESCDSDLSVSAPSSSNFGFGPEKHLLDDEIGVKLHYQKLTGTPTASLSDDLVGFPHSQEALELCSDSNLRVTLQKVWKPGELVLVLYLTNQNQASASISDVISALEAPSNLIALFDSSAGNKLQNDNIGPLSWVRHKVVLKYQSPALHMNFGGKISYRDPNRTLRHLFFNHTLSMKDILRPLVISTEEFELKWTDASFEKRQKMFSSSRNCQEFSKRAEQELNIYTVEIIGGKVILAGTLMESGICLLHASCDGDSLELSIKSCNRLLNDAVLKHCVTVFR